MGVTISNVFSRLFGKKEIKIVMLGLDNAGKTTILYKLKLGEIVQTIPSIGFNVETIIHKNIHFQVWDVAGGGDKIRPLWYHYYQHCEAVIYVLDSTDRERIEEVKWVLSNLVRDEKFNGPVLIFANKQDVPNAMTSEEITDKLELSKLSFQSFHLQVAAALQGSGLSEGLDWLENELAPNSWNLFNY